MSLPVLSLAETLKEFRPWYDAQREIIKIKNFRPMVFIHVDASPLGFRKGSLYLDSKVFFDVLESHFEKPSPEDWLSVLQPQETTMPSKTKKQHNFMEAVAHSPAFAKKAGVPQSVGKDFAAADKGKTFKKGGPTPKQKPR